jgi:hypothetical protein
MYSALDGDIKNFFKSSLSQLVDKIDVDHKELLPKKSEVFTFQVLKDTSGAVVKNEAVHNIMHRFVRKAKKHGFNKMLVLGAFGMGKSFCADTQVLTYSGDLKKVEDVKVGDLIMGDDGTPRKVLFLGHGKERAYKVTLKNGDSFECNESHILAFTVSNRIAGYQRGEKIVLPLKDFLELPEWVKKNCLKLYKVPLSFKYKPVQLDPYFYGIWLGDGHIHNFRFTINNFDTEIVNCINLWANENGYSVRQTQSSSGCFDYSLNFINGSTKKTDHWLFLKSSCIDGKRIDPQYLKNHRLVRLQLLAGLIDTDGYLSDNCFEIATKWIGMRDDILFLCRSLGFSVSHRIKYVNDVPYYVIIISGNTHLIPCKTRKKADVRKQIKNPLVYGFDVEPVGEKEYFGFGLDGNHLFLLGDFTVTHNTEQICVGYVLYRIAQDPNILVKMVHVSETEAVKRCRALREYIAKDDDFKKIAPHVQPTSIWGSQRFIVKRDAMSKDGTVEAYGILSTALGGRANLIILDDPQDLKTAVLEPTMRKKIEETFKNVWLTRLIPNNSEVIVLMNKWHENDLANMIQANPVWSWMELAVSEDLNNLLYKDSFGAKYTLPLWTLFNKNDLIDRLKVLGQRDFNRGYRLIPYTDADKSFPNFKRCCHFGISPSRLIENEKNWIFVAGIDFASKKRPGTILSVLAVNKFSGMKVPVEVVCLRGSQELPHYMIKFYQKYGIDLFMAENNGVQDALIEMLTTSLGSEKYKKYRLKIEGFLTGSNKADPLIGLPSIEKEFENNEWMFCFEQEPKVGEIDANNPWMLLFQEFLHHPFYETTDIVMSFWFARAGANQLIRKDTGPNIY